MVDVSEIVGEASFKRWLEALPQGNDAERDEARRWAVLLAHRAAMRVLPEFWAQRLANPTRAGEAATLAILRMSMISALAGKYPTQRINDSARAAAPAPAPAGRSVAISEAGPAMHAARTAVAKNPRAAAANAVGLSMRTEESARLFHKSDAIKFTITRAETEAAKAAAHNTVRVDASALISGRDPYLLPLWPAENPLAGQWSTIRTHPSTQSPGWRFWIDWYDRALTGQPQDWKLLEKVALIDPKDWDEGEDHVNALIQQIIRDHRPPPPKLTPEIRAHLDLVLRLRDPSRHSAGYLRTQFEALEQAYRQKVGCPNETPEELQPIVTLARAFGQIEWLLGHEADKDRLITQLQVEVAVLKANNVALIAAAHGPKASLMRDVFAATLGSAFGGIAATMILANVALVGGPATADSLEPLSQLITGPVIDLPPSIPH